MILNFIKNSDAKRRCMDPCKNAQLHTKNFLVGKYFEILSEIIPQLGVKIDNGKRE